MCPKETEVSFADAYFHDIGSKITSNAISPWLFRHNILHSDLLNLHILHIDRIEECIRGRDTVSKRFVFPLIQVIR